MLADFVKDWIVPAFTLLNFVALVWAIFMSPFRRSADAIKEVKEEVDGIDHRLSQTETLVKQLPDRETVHKIDLGLTKLEGQMNAMAVSVGAASQSVQRIEQFLLEQARGK